MHAWLQGKHHFAVVAPGNTGAELERRMPDVPVIALVHEEAPASGSGVSLSCSQLAADPLAAMTRIGAAAGIAMPPSAARFLELAAALRLPNRRPGRCWAARSGRCHGVQQ